MIDTSHAVNKPEKIARVFNQRTFYAVVLGLSIGLITCALFQIVNGVALTLIAAISAGVPGFVSSFLYQGEFPGDRLERAQFKIASFLGIFRKAFTGKDLAGHWSVQPAHDPESIYNAAGDEFLGFEIVEVIRQQELMNLCARLHKKLSPDIQITYLRIAERYQTDFLTKYRSALLEKSLMGIEYLVIIKIPYLKATEEKRAELLDSLPSFFYRIERERLRHFTEKLVDPHKKNAKGKSPVFEASYVTDGRYAFPYPDECYGGIAMCELGLKTGEEFPNIFRPAFSMRSIISTTIIKQGFLRDSVLNAWRSLREEGMVGFGKVSAAQKKANEKAEEDEAVGSYDALQVYCQALVYGRPDEVNTCLKRIKEMKDTPELIKPLLCVELGAIQGALGAVTPGNMAAIPTRLMKVRNLTESAYYLPLYAPPTDLSVEYPLVLRTVHNTPFYINHAGLSETPLTLYVGKSGSGKSSLMALTVRAHWLLGVIYKRPVAIIVGDVGGSMAFMADDNTADLVFNMERLNGGDFPALAIHPLHVFLDRDPTTGEINTAQKLLAIEMMAFLLRASTSDAAVTTVLRNAMEAMIEKESVFRLSVFGEYMDKAAADLIEQAPSGRDLLAKDWFYHKLRLALFSRGGTYGKIFDPDEVGRDTMRDVVNFYYNCDEELFEIPDLASAFIGLCWSVARSIGQRFKSTNDDARDTLMLMDEFDRKSAFLGKMTLKSMKDQSRKYGIVPGLGIQSFDYLSTQTDEKSGQSGKTIYEGVGNTFFYGVGQEDVYSKVAAIFDQTYIPGQEPRGKLREMIDIAARINKEKERVEKETAMKLRPGQLRKERVYSVGFFDKSRNIQELYVDIEKDFLWMFTTHPGGRAIRRAVQREVEPNLLKASILLAKHGPWPIPSETPSPDDIRKILERISYANETEAEES